MGFPCGSAGNESTHNEGNLGSIPGLGRSPGKGKGYPLQYSGMENSMDYTVHGITKSRTRQRFSLSLVYCTSPISSTGPGTKWICNLLKCNFICWNSWSFHWGHVPPKSLSLFLLSVFEFLPGWHFFFFFSYLLEGISWLCRFSSVQSLSHVPLFTTPWTAAHQTSLSITNSRSLLKLMSIEAVIPSNHLILCCPLLLLPSIFPSIRVIIVHRIYVYYINSKSESCLIQISDYGITVEIFWWTKAKSDRLPCHLPLCFLSFFYSFLPFSLCPSHEVAKVLDLNISPSSEKSGLISFRIDWFWSCSPRDSSRVFSNTTVRRHQFFSTQPLYGPTIISVHDYWKNHSFDYIDLCWQSNVCFLICCLGLSQLFFQGTSVF